MRTAKRLAGAIAAAVVAAGLLTIAATPAQADTPGCVSRAEANQITDLVDNSWPRPRAIRNIADTSGTLYFSNWDDYDFGYYDYDEWGNEYWVPDVLYGGHDVVRSYKRCGGGQLGVWYDNYTSGYNGLRALRTGRPANLEDRFWDWWVEVPYPGTMFRGAQGNDSGGLHRAVPKDLQK